MAIFPVATTGTTLEGLVDREGRTHPSDHEKEVIKDRYFGKGTGYEQGGPRSDARCVLSVVRVPHFGEVISSLYGVRACWNRVLESIGARGCFDYSYSHDGDVIKKDTTSLTLYPNDRNYLFYSSYFQDCVDREESGRPSRIRDRSNALVVPFRSTVTGVTTFPVRATGTIPSLFLLLLLCRPEG
jgi:hypothetical protein